MSNNGPNFVEGMRIFGAKESQPEFIKGELIIDCQEFENYMRANCDNTGEIRITIKESRAGKLWLDRNDWRPHGQQDGYQQNRQGGYNQQSNNNQEQVPPPPRPAAPPPQMPDEEDELNDIPF